MVNKKMNMIGRNITLIFRNLNIFFTWFLQLLAPGGEPDFLAFPLRSFSAIPPVWASSAVDPRAEDSDTTLTLMLL